MALSVTVAKHKLNHGTFAGSNGHRGCYRCNRRVADAVQGLSARCGTVRRTAARSIGDRPTQDAATIRKWRRQPPNTGRPCIGPLALEIKLVRPFGDNGKPAENWSVNLLHPYAGNASAIGDCLRLEAWEGLERRACVAIGYEHRHRILLWNHSSPVSKRSPDR